MHRRTRRASSAKSPFSFHYQFLGQIDGNPWRLEIAVYLEGDMRIILLIGILAFQFNAKANCPKRAGDSELTLNQVMYHFGKSIRIADTMIRQGLNDPTSVDVARVQESIEMMTTAEDCAQAVLDDSSGKLSPSKVSRMNPTDRAAFLQSYSKLMTEFKTMLTDFKAMLIPLLSNVPTVAEFQALMAKEKLIMKKAAEAHTELGQPL